MAKGATLVLEYEAHKAQGRLWRPLWDRVLDYFDTRQSTLYDEYLQPGERRKQARDKTGVLSRRIFEAGMTSHIVPSDQQWMGYQEAREQFKDRQDVKDFWFETTELFLRYINDSNFYSVFPRAMGQVAVPGTCCVFMERGKKTLFNFRIFDIGSFWVAEDDEGRVDSVYREFKMTARQAKEKWPEADLGAKIQEALDAGTPKCTENFDFVHIVRPRKAYDPRKQDRANMPYESFYLNLADKHVVDEGGYRTFPYAVVRGDRRPGEVFGRSIAMDALDEQETLDIMVQSKRKAAELAVNPDIKKKASLPYPVRRGGGKVTLVNNMDDVDEWQTSSRFDIARISMEDERETVRKFFFVDLFQMLDQLDKGQMTAFEVGQRLGEKLLIIGPLVNSIESEMLRVFAVRGLDIMFESNVVPPPPVDVPLVAPKIIYSNRVSQALSALQANDMMVGIDFIERVASLFPSFLDNINSDEFTEGLENINFPPANIHPRDVVEQIRAQKAQQEQAMIAGDMLNQGVDTLNKLPPDVRKQLAGLM